MAEVLFGKNKILLFREFVGEDNIEDAKGMVFQTEHTFSYSRSLDRILTKSGTIVKVGGLESEVSIEAIQAKTDPIGTMLRASVLAGKKLELWEVTVDEEMKDVDDKYPSVYCRGYLDSWENGANVEDESTISSNFIIEMVPQTGVTGLSTAQEEAVQYAFEEAVGTPIV